MRSKRRRRVIADTSKSLILSVATIMLPLSALGQARDVKCNQCVHQKDIAKFAVSNSKIRNGAVTSSKIKSGAVTSHKIKNGTIKSSDLSSGAKPAGAAFSESGNNTSLQTTDVTVNSVTLKLPGPGIVVVNVGGYARFESNPSDATCAIRKDKDSLVAGWRVSGSNANINSSRMPTSSTRAFSETGGIVTYNLNCKLMTGTMTLFSPWMNAIYVPQNYSATPPAQLKNQIQTDQVQEPRSPEDLH